MADLDRLVEELSKLTVLEAAELSKKLEEAWGVSAAAPVAMAMAPGAGGGAGALSGAAGMVAPGWAVAVSSGWAAAGCGSGSVTSSVGGKSAAGGAMMPSDMARVDSERDSGGGSGLSVSGMSTGS